MRNYAIDNLKLLMITLVVFGHIIEPVISGSESLSAIFKFIYLFHMPVFVILAGMFSKSDPSKKNLESALKSNLIPFFTFSLIYEACNIIIDGRVSSYTLGLQPYWILWFLYSLFLWKILLPIFIRLRFPVLISFTIALFIGFFDEVGYFLGLSRTFYFFPFFIIGHILGQESQIKNNILKLPKLLFLILITLGVYLSFEMSNIPHQTLFGSFSYGKLGDSEIKQFIIRGCILILSLAVSISIIALSPNFKISLSQLGSNTIYVYLYHGLIIKLLSHFGIIVSIFNISTYIFLALSILLSFLITLLLSSSFVSNFTERYLFKTCRKIIFKEIS